jgi:hypothetical protein
MSFGKHIGRRKATLAEIRSLAETITAGEPHDFSIEVTANGMTCKFTSLDELERYVERYPVVAFPTTFKLTINKYDNGMDRYASVELKEDDTWVYIDSREQEWTLGSALAITNSLKRDRLG